MLESKIQSKIIKKLSEDGWLCVKLIRTNLNGIPDILALRNGVAMFVEVKNENGVISDLQHELISRIQSMGFDVKIWTDYDTEYNKSKKSNTTLRF